nr:YjcZ family sporulation protein [Bacillus sp. MUM 116]
MYGYGFGYDGCCGNPYGGFGYPAGGVGCGYGFGFGGFALIVVLFILLIIIGASWHTKI